MSLSTLLIYTLVPVAALVLATMMGMIRIPRKSVISLFQHFAAGVVFAAVAIELLPALQNDHSPWTMTAGFVLGVLFMLALKRFSENLGMLVPIGIDLFIDGVLVAIGFATGEEGGLILLIGLSIETAALGLAEAPSLAMKGFSKSRVMRITALLGAALIGGAVFGNEIVGLSSGLTVVILAFGVSALLYLVTEGLLTEAHETEDTPLVTSMFFLGFFIPLLLRSLQG